jgi:hypothetical protein
MCRGENVQCKECSRLSTRIVQLCIRGELMVNCPEIIVEGVSLEKEQCRLCRYGNGKGKIIMPPSVLANANNYDRKSWRASKEQPMPGSGPVRWSQGLKPRESSRNCSSSDGESEASSQASFQAPSPEEPQLRRSISIAQQSDLNQRMNLLVVATQA